VLSREDSIRLMGPDGRWLVHALCIYDLAERPGDHHAAVPNAYWSMTMYSAGGETFYSLNDRQAGIDRWPSCSGSPASAFRPTRRWN
jgi:uncharacterized membrane protein